MFFRDGIQGSLRRAEYGGVIMQSGTKRALGGKDSPDIMKAFTNALFKTVCNLAN